MALKGGNRSIPTLEGRRCRTIEQRAFAELIKPLTVRPGHNRAPAPGLRPATPIRPIKKKKDGVELLQTGVSLLAEYQARLAAQDTYGVLVVPPSARRGGKDGTIRHVMSGVNPQGVHVAAFKVPSTEELDHDYLWRYAQRLPARGEIGIFNRSHYEEVLVVRVHPEFLERQHLPAAAKRRRASGSAATARSTTGSATSPTTASAS